MAEDTDKLNGRMNGSKFPEVDNPHINRSLAWDAIDPSSNCPSQDESYKVSDSDGDDNFITMAEVNYAFQAAQSQLNLDEPCGNALTAQNQLEGSTPQQSRTFWSADIQPCTLPSSEELGLGLAYCPFKLVQVYPHRFVGNARRDKAVKWFQDNILAGRSWDMYYICDPYNRRDPLILIPTAQFAKLLRDINSELGFHLEIPDGKDGEQFEIFFEESPHPRFMGKVKNELTYNNTKKSLGATPDDLSKLDTKSLQLFKEKMDQIYNSIKSSKSRKDPGKQHMKMVSRQKGRSQTIKRAQRYLGLRQRLSLAPYSNATNAGWNVMRKVPFGTESAVKFICVDIEANELNPSTITEIGLAILDTKDIEEIPPGENGKNWLPYITAHHLRINEYKSIFNSRYIQGCPDAFNFGESEFIDRKDVCHRLGELIGDSQSSYKSKIVMVGHDIVGDLKYLQSLGYSIWDLEEFFDEIDTKDMFQRIQFATEGRSLEFLCKELGMPGHNFHNAGNDAMYTLHAMIAMAVGKKAGGPLTESEKAGWQHDAKLEEWSEGEQDDGGVPVKSQAPTVLPSLPARASGDQYKSHKWW